MAAIRTIKVRRVEASTSSQSDTSIMENDNNVDTTVLGSNCLPINYFEISVDVSVWDKSAVNVEFPTIHGEILHDHPICGKFYMLVYH